MLGHTSSTLDHSPAETGSKGTTYLRDLRKYGSCSCLPPFVAQLLARMGSDVPNQWALTSAPLP